MHTRKIIKEYMRQRLIAANTAAGDRVYLNRVRDIPKDKLPALQIRTLRERAEKLNEAPVSYARTVQLGVVCICAADDRVDDAIDDLAEEVEDALISIQVYGLLEDANRVEYISTDLTLEIAESEIGAGLVAFEVQYDTYHLPELENLEGVNIKLYAKEKQEDIDNGEDPIFTDNVDLPAE